MSQTLAPNTPAAGINPPFSAAALALILDAEGCDQPSAWPGGASGITIGVGFDLGYESAADFADAWKPLLPEHDYVRLLNAIGVKGEAAHWLARSGRFDGIRIPTATARQVFTARTLPRYVTATRIAFRGWSLLPLDAQGALVSLVYNRGLGMAGDSRLETRAIGKVLADGVQRGDLAEIAKQLRAMKRLWAGKGLDGLLHRREAEAQLVERAG